MVFAWLLLIGREVAVLFIAWTVGGKAPNDFFLLVFLLALLCYRQYRHRSDQIDFDKKQNTHSPEVATGLERFHSRMTMVEFGTDIVMWIAVLVIALR
jgi:hypothetical protein